MDFRFSMLLFQSVDMPIAPKSIVSQIHVQVASFGKPFSHHNSDTQATYNPHGCQFISPQARRHQLGQFQFCSNSNTWLQHRHDSPRVLSNLYSLWGSNALLHPIRLEFKAIYEVIRGFWRQVVQQQKWFFWHLFLAAPHGFVCPLQPVFSVRMKPLTGI